MPQKSKFKLDHPLEARQTESARMIQKYPDRVPVIIERKKGSRVADIEKYKFLVPSDMTLGQFMFVIRKRIKIRASDALFILIEDTIQPVHTPLYKIYAQHKDEDGFVYMFYSGENTFG